MAHVPHPFYPRPMIGDESDRVARDLRPGRGTASNRAGRFEPYGRVAVDDGWDLEEGEHVLRTEVAVERPRSVITRNTSPDVPFDRSINPYRGCEHGCVYCFARPSHAFLGLSPGLDFETRLVARPTAPQVLAQELARRGYRPEPIAIGTNTDPYQPIEKRFRIMRGILEVLRDFGHPVTIVTKGALVERDADILGALAVRGLVRVGISVTTLDRDLARRMEPRAAAPERRLRMIRTLADAGVPVRVMMAPVIPGLNDHEIERLLEAARDAGAAAAAYVALRLPREVAQLFRDWLEEARPERAAKVMNQVREMHGGRDYDPAWGKRMKGEGVRAELIGRRFAAARARLGLDGELPKLRRDLFAVPAADDAQLALF
jgi:DNA repair photolyase